MQRMSDAPIFLLPGMSKNTSVYARLAPLLPNCQIVNWIEPQEYEPIASYAKRIAAQLPNGECYVGGVSFGGIVAVEVARIIGANRCFLISSILSPSQLPPWIRPMRLLSWSSVSAAMLVAGAIAQRVPRRLRSRTTLKTNRWAGKEGLWYRWATSAVLRWNPDCGCQPSVFHIHGDRDRTFPVRYASPDIVIPGGGHLLPLTHATEVAEAMCGEIEAIDAALGSKANPG